MRTETGFAEINGARLLYELSGHGANVALLHEGIADSGMWDEQIEPFSAHFRVLRYDARGYGRSSLPGGPYSHAGDLAALLPQLEHVPAALVGASMGARTALDLTLQHPELVRALVLVVPGLGGHEWSAEMDRIDAEEEALLDAGDVEAAVELNLRTWVDGPRRPPEAVGPALRERVRAMQRRAFDVQLPAFASDDLPRPELLDPPASTRLADVRVPTLVVVGDADQPDILAIGERLEHEIRGARSAVIEDTAHVPNMEKPDEFNRLVLGFLEALS